MSREERRQYQRMMRNMERGPSLPPAAQARIERQRAKRAQLKPTARSADLTRGFWLRAVAIAAVVGFLGMSVQWSEGLPRALYVGIAAAFLAFVVVVGFRLFQRRAIGRVAGGPGSGADQSNR
jgi:hypothetical protein